MSYKVLEQNGIDNENVDGGAFNRFTAGGCDGILKGVLSECELAAAGNGISISTGEIIMCGIRVKITAPETLFVSGVPISDTQYQIIVQATLQSNRSLSVSFLLRPSGALRQDALYVAEQGVYEVEIGTFNHSSSGIKDINRTLCILESAGGAQNGNSEEEVYLYLTNISIDSDRAKVNLNFKIFDPNKVLREGDKLEICNHQLYKRGRNYNSPTRRYARGRRLRAIDGFELSKEQIDIIHKNQAYTIYLYLNEEFYDYTRRILMRTDNSLFECPSTVIRHFRIVRQSKREEARQLLSNVAVGIWEVAGRIMTETIKINLK
ncbi:MAG: hypothetical protein K2N23_04550 [Clostridia bacterium]|nr:hypothetical protein [Clostridia bacterium]